MVGCNPCMENERANARRSLSSAVLHAGQPVVVVVLEHIEDVLEGRVVDSVDHRCAYLAGTSTPDNAGLTTLGICARVQIMGSHANCKFEAGQEGFGELRRRQFLVT